jgi:hypothetical protein
MNTNYSEQTREIAKKISNETAAGFLHIEHLLDKKFKGDGAETT